MPVTPTSGLLGKIPTTYIFSDRPSILVTNTLEPMNLALSFPLPDPGIGIQSDVKSSDVRTLTRPMLSGSFTSIIVAFSLTKSEKGAPVASMTLFTAARYLACDWKKSVIQPPAQRKYPLRPISPQQHTHTALLY